MTTALPADDTHGQARPGVGRSLARAGAAVAPAMLAANLLQYALQLTASRSLEAAPFGALGALLGLGVVGSVPMLALQAVATRHVALVRHDADALAAETTRLLRAGLLVSVAVAVVGVVLAPAVAAFLHVGTLDAAAMALGVAPLALVGAAQGVLQGEERFGRLAAAFVGVAALRVGGAVLPLLAGSGVLGALTGTAVGAVLAAAGLSVALRPRSGAAPAGAADGFWSELRLAGGGMLGLLVLGALDLLMARHLLAGEASGRYAAGALVARACFWAPQFVAVLVLPRLAAGHRHVALRAAAVVAGLGVLATTVAAVVPAALVTLVFGPEYAALVHRLGLFALAGSLLALVQLLLYSGIATGGGRVAGLVWVAVGVETAVLLLLRPGFDGIVLTACACTAAVAVVGLALAARPSGTTAQDVVDAEADHLVVE